MSVACLGQLWSARIYNAIFVWNCGIGKFKNSYSPLHNVYIWKRTVANHAVHTCAWSFNGRYSWGSWSFGVNWWVTIVMRATLEIKGQSSYRRWYSVKPLWASIFKEAQFKAKVVKLKKHPYGQSRSLLNLLNHIIAARQSMFWRQSYPGCLLNLLSPSNESPRFNEFSTFTRNLS